MAYQSEPVILYHNSISNIHDLNSYIMFLKYAWVDHWFLMVGMLLLGFISGIVLYKSVFNKVVTISNG